MARWALRKQHYLKVPGTEWEYIEISRESGRQARKRFEVPLLLDPENPGDCNYDGECIVAHAEGKHMPRDWIFEGPPTPDMEPYDDEAQEISNRYKSTWVNPIDSLPTHGDFSQSLIQAFEGEISRLGGRASVTAGMKMPESQSVDPGEFAKLKSMVAQLAEQNAALMAKLNEKPAAPARRA
jgi:hypothetical protein